MDPYRPLDDDGRATLARCLVSASAALATLRGGRPMVTRTACLWLEGMGLTLLVSDLSDHAAALAADPACSLLLGEPGGRGDPLTHPRLTVTGDARPADKAALRDAWRRARPKTTLYYDFADFRPWRVQPVEAMLNAGFGRAYRVPPAEIG